MQKLPAGKFHLFLPASSRVRLDANMNERKKAGTAADGTHAAHCNDRNSARPLSAAYDRIHWSSRSRKSGEHRRQIMGGRMYPLTLDGLDQAMRELVR